ncbi:MAG: 50S ribosomal protein L36 [Betaproteobacteria bacterium]|nr:50S ribosomal protein L36 [Betaproteobacteria bacterium]
MKVLASVKKICRNCKPYDLSKARIVFRAK